MIGFTINLKIKCFSSRRIKCVHLTKGRMRFVSKKILQSGRFIRFLWLAVVSHFWVLIPSTGPQVFIVL